MFLIFDFSPCKLIGSIVRNAAVLACLCVVLLPSQWSLAALPPAGVRIENQAFASYPNAQGVATQIGSNIVSITVGQVGAFTLTASQERTAVPNGQVAFTHTLTNTGNGVDSYSLSAQNNAGAFDFTSIAIYADLNGDGIADNNIPITQTPVLAPGQSFYFVVVAVTPVNGLAGQRDQLTITATGNAAQAATGGYSPAASQSNIDGATITFGPLISIQKSFSIVQGLSPSDDIEVALTYKNTGFADASNVLISDIVPGAGANYNTQGFSYIPASAAWNNLALSDAAGGDPAGINYQYDTIGVYANTIRATIAVVPKNTQGVLKFKLRVKSGLAVGTALTRNIAQATYTDGANTLTTDSNPASYTVTGRQAGVDLTLTKTAGALVVPGQCSVFTLNVNNIGTQTSTGEVRVTDTLPAGLEYQPECNINGVVARSGGLGWSCPTLPATGLVSCRTFHNYTPNGNDGPLLSIVVRAVAEQLSPPLPAITAVPNTVTVLNQAIVSNDGEPVVLRDNNTAQAPLLVGPAATLKGHVWLDVNHDRKFQTSSGDVAMAGWRVEVLQNGIVVATVLTQADGSYSFTGLLPGQYQIRFKDPANNVISGRPVCNEQGLLPSSSNCARADLSNNASALSANNDMLTVTVTPGDTVAQLSLPLDPSGVVYDSVTRKPVAGAIVKLVVPSGFDPSIHLIGGAANLTQTTGVNGFYQYLLTPAGAAYCKTLPNGCMLTLQVTPPAAYKPPNSQFLPPAPSLGCAGVLNCLDPTGLAPAGGVYTVQNQATAPAVGQPTPYYMNIRLSEDDPDVVNNHIPLDPISAFGENLLIEKTASKPVAEIGDFVDYTVKIKNGATVALNDLKLIDTLPLGFKLVRGSSKLDGTFVADPVSLSSSKVQWTIPFVGAGKVVLLTYRMRVGQGAAQGNGINSITAVCNYYQPSCANLAQAKVQVIDGVLSGKPIVIGKVFLDCNRDRVQSDREIGVPGVRIITQDGTYAVTDAEGKFSLYGLNARTHVLKLDPLSLPIDWEPVMLGNRQSGDASSRFVDLSFGEIHKANFADGACHDSTVKEVHKRRELALDSSFENILGAAGLWDKTLDYNTLATSTDPRSKSATGDAAVVSGAAWDVLGSPSAVNKNNNTNGNNYNNLANPFASGTASDNDALNDANAALASRPLEKQLEKTDNTLGFLNLKEAQILPIAQTHVQIKGVQGTQLTLYVNDALTPESRIGKRSVNETAQTQGIEYIAVALKAGPNTLRIVQTDTLGIARGQQSITVMAPGSLASISIAPVGVLKADSKSNNTVRIMLKDSFGTPVTDRTQLTLTLTGLSANAHTPARITAPDQNPSEDGTQVFVQGGSIDIPIAAPDTPANARFNVEAGTLKQSTVLDFLPSLRPLLGVGIVDGAIQLHKLKTSQLNNNGRSTFDQELQCLGRPTLSIASNAGQWDCLHKDFAQGKGQADLTTALYFKGAVKGEYLLTLAYDNAKDVKARVFRDIAPDEFYPIYGDASQRGFDANSTEKLYLRVDKGSSYVLYGDFTTASPQVARQLTQYSRSMTGAKLHLGDESNQLEVFATRDSLKQKVVDIPANGTSGPFELGATGVINSEKVEVVVRDRQSPGVVLSRKTLARFVDYEIEAYTGRLLLRAPLASVDADLNPVSLHIVLEQDDATASFWTAGVQGHMALAKGVEIGGMAVKSFQDQAGQSLYGAYVSAELGQHAKVTAEVAHSQQMTAGIASSGNAARAELMYKTPQMDARVYAQKADASFENPSSSIAKGQTDIGGKVSYKIGEKTQLAAELVRLQDGVNHNKTQGVLLKVEHQLDQGFKVEAGIRHANKHTETVAAGTGASAPIAVTDDTFTSVRVKATAPLGNQASVFIEAEQAFNDKQRRLFALGAEYRFANRGRVYAKHEFANTLNSEFSLTPNAKAYNTVIGVDTPLFDNTQAFSEYRIKDAIGGQDAQAAIGLRQTWLPAQGLRLNTSFERTHILSTAPGAVDPGASTAATLAAQYTAAPDWKATGRLEWRDTRTQTNWLNTLGLAYKLNQNWSALARSTLSMQHNHGTQASASAGDLNKYRLQVGAAYRDLDRDVWNGVAKLEQRGEHDTTGGAALKRSVSIASTHVHYQLNRDWWVSGSAAIKRAVDDSNQLRSRSQGALLAARLNWDLTHRWDAGLRLLASRNGDKGIGSGNSGSGAGLASKQTKLGAGLELGYMLVENTWLSLGYNIWGVKDKDLTSNDYTEAGWYVRLRYKFDETLFDNGASIKAPSQTSPSSQSMQ